MNTIKKKKRNKAGAGNSTHVWQTLNHESFSACFEVLRGAGMTNIKRTAQTVQKWAGLQNLVKVREDWDFPGGPVGKSQCSQ